MSNVISAQEARRGVWRPLRELPRRSDLVSALTRREVASRYRGSVLGPAWPVLAPAVMISVFTFVFAGIFGARFGAGGSAWDYAIYLFCGLLPWTAFQESLQQSSGVVVSHANLVKRVVFPLEVLPLSQTLAAFVSQGPGLLVLVLAALVVRGELHATLLWLPLLVGAQLLAALGGAWLVASLGVFVRDTPQILALLLPTWMYLTPIIYPEAIVPERYRAVIGLNPFTPLVRNYRRVILEGACPDWRGLAYFAAFAAVTFVLGYLWFAKTRRNFADVI